MPILQTYTSSRRRKQFQNVCVCMCVCVCVCGGGGGGVPPEASKTSLSYLKMFQQK